jgi:hypothetical protein
MSAIYEYLMQAREQDIKRRVRRASGRPSVRDVLRSKADATTREPR